MTTYKVDFEAFREKLGRAPHLMEGMRETIGQLVERYDLRNREILCIASGYAGEEYWLWRLGKNRLTIIDLDINGDIEPVLKTLPEGDLTYIINDALYVKPEPCDALFMSGFTPDLKARFETFERAGNKWPKKADPLHGLIIQLARSIRPGGYLFSLSFAYGIDVKVHPDMLPAMDRQLRRENMRLLEVYRMTENVGVMLFVGYRGKDGPSLGEPLSRIHGRAPAEPVEMVWPLEHRRGFVTSLRSALRL